MKSVDKNRYDIMLMYGIAIDGLKPRTKFDSCDAPNGQYLFIVPFMSKTDLLYIMDMETILSL